MLDRKKHRQEVEALKADNRQKDMNLSKDYVTEWRTYIAEPLAIAFLLRASAIRKRAFMAFGLASVLLSLTTSCAVHRTATESSRFKVQEFKV
jgi:hypothetical protein